MLVFVYGTLVDPERADAVLDDWRYEGSAVLDGLHRVDGDYPTLAPGGSVDGRLLRTRDVDRLDAYEGVDRGLYVRVPVPGPGERVEVYVGDPKTLDATVEFPGDGPFTESVREYVDDHDVRVAATTTGH